MTKPILYLDVDGVLIQFREDRTRLHYEYHMGGFPANRVGDFIQWADRNFEVRWLTCWAMHGAMNEHAHEKLQAITWETIPNWDNPKSWAATGDKTRGIDFDDPRPWFWLDDETKHDRPLLPEKFGDRLIKTNSSVDPDALLYSAREMYDRLHYEFKTYIEKPCWASDKQKFFYGGFYE